MSEIRIEEEVEDIPCGKSITIRYFDGETLVRQDVRIEVDKGLFVGAFDGEVQ